MKPLSYPAMATMLGVHYCRGMTPHGRYCALEHEQGQVDPDGVVHYRERPMRKSNTYSFLKLAAQAEDILRPGIRESGAEELGRINDDVPWRRIYRMDRLARELGLHVHIQLPARYWAADKAFVLAGIAGLSNDEPLRREAFDWAPAMIRYQYGVTTSPGGPVDPQPTKAAAADIARDWVISPLRTSPRESALVRRAGWDGPWVVVATWKSPEAQR